MRIGINGSIYQTRVQPEESLSEAIVRASIAANESGCVGFEILCDLCGQPIGNSTYGHNLDLCMQLRRNRK